MLFYSGMICANGATVCVSVLDPAEFPIEGAEVRVQERSASLIRQIETSEYGTACIADLPEGDYSVEAIMEGFYSVTYRPVSLTDSGPRLLGFKLDFANPPASQDLADTALLAGVLLENVTLTASSRICIREQDAAPDEAECQVTKNGLGGYRFYLPSGSYIVDINYDERAYQSTIDIVAPGFYRNVLRISDETEVRHQLPKLPENPKIREMRK